VVVIGAGLAGELLARRSLEILSSFRKKFHELLA
jgi:hypothetical protein